MFACIFVPNFPSDRSSQQALLDCAYAFSPRVEDTAPGAVVFDIEGLERLFGSYDEIAAQISKKISAFGWKAHVAIGANPDAAVVMARSCGRPMHEAPVEILAPTDERSECKPDAKRKRDSAQPQERAQPSRKEILETLDRWGIRTLGTFAKLPVVQVSERLGQEGVQLLKLAKGMASRPLVPHQDPLQFMEIMELDFSIDAIESLTFILSRLLDQLCLRLRTRNLATNEVRLTLSKTYERILHLPLPSRNPRVLMKLLILDLEAHPPGFGVTSVKVEAIPVKPRVIQNGLFVPLSPEPEKLQLTLARIAAIVGEENVGSPEVLDTHRPDAFRMNRGLHGLRGSHSRHLRPISIRLFRPPIPFHGQIIRASGPWYSSGDWWTSDRKWNREEWDVELFDGLYRIYRDFETNRWFVEGVYD